MRGGTIERDLRARDFTINALAVQWQGRKAVQLVDVTGGQSDLEQGILRRVSPSSLAEDPVRLLRAVRFAVQLGFAVEEQTELQMLRMADTIRLASTERVRDELWKTLQSEQPAAAVEMLRRYGLLPYVLPEVAGIVGVEQSAPHVLDVYQHTLAAVTFAKQLRDWLSGEEIPGLHGRRRCLAGGADALAFPAARPFHAGDHGRPPTYRLAHLACLVA